jgi:hypothetical protein
MALLVDERRLVYNAMAFNYGEKERLIPLIVFPEEVVYYQSNKKDLTPINQDEFLGKVATALGRPIDPIEVNTPLTEEEFVKTGFDSLTKNLLRLDEPSIQGSACVVGLPCDCIRKGFDKLLHTP